MGNSGSFTSERLRGNQYAKGNKPNSTSFKRGHLPQNFKGGIQTPKNDCVHLYDLQTKKRIRRPKTVWESYNGELPAGWVIYHLDGDKTNDDINNLKAITRADLAVLNRRKSLYEA
jgi:hypothetical protein